MQFGLELAAWPLLDQIEQRPLCNIHCTGRPEFNDRRKIGAARQTLQDVRAPDHQPDTLLRSDYRARPQFDTEFGAKNRDDFTRNRRCLLRKVAHAAFSVRHVRCNGMPPDWPAGPRRLNRKRRLAERPQPRVSYTCSIFVLAGSTTVSRAFQDASGFCRDCMTPAKPGMARCHSCGSPRLVRHPELESLSIAHIDCDAFYASVEKRDRPELADRPVIIGGGKRGVVSTACYVARIHGVRSAMPMFKALDACPDAVVIKPDMEKYAHVGRQVRQMMMDLTPLVQPLSIDEAFLDLTGTEKLHKDIPARTLARFATRVETEIGITVSVGLAANKFLAKIASDLEKPRGFSVIGAAEAKGFLRDKPVSMIWGVGKAFAATLKADGITTIGQLQDMELDRLMRAYGTMGKRLHDLSRAEDSRTVHANDPMKSVSAETTFDTDLSTREELLPVLRALSEKVSARLKKSGIAGYTVVLKLKTHDFKLRTRNHRLDGPTRLADRIWRTGMHLLEKETGKDRFRLIGIGVTDLTSDERADPPDLVDTAATRRAAAEAALDKVREKFGHTSVETGATFGRSRRLRQADSEES